MATRLLSLETVRAMQCVLLHPLGKVQVTVVECCVNADWRSRLVMKVPAELGHLLLLTHWW